MNDKTLFSHLLIWSFALLLVLGPAFATPPPMEDGCFTSAAYFDVSCEGGEITTDEYVGCRYIVCENDDDMMSALACDKPDEGGPTYFELYLQDQVGDSVTQICVGGTCVGNYGFMVGSELPYCPEERPDEPVDVVCGGNEPVDPPDSTGATVTPENLQVELGAGEGFLEEKSLTTDQTPIGKLDVMFLFDLTGSMNDDLADAKASANDLITDINGVVPDSAFGVGSFMDYTETYHYCGYSATYGDASSGDYPFSLDEDITSDASAVASAINGLSIGYGFDGPEAYARALHESLSVDWRDGARRVVVIFEDNVPHDCSLATYGCGSGTGVDPGADALAGTGDDLAWDAVVADLKAAGITVLVLEADFGVCDGPWDYLASETGGVREPISNADNLVDEITALIEGVAGTVSALSVIPQEGFEDWVEWSPDAYFNVSGNQTVGFDINVTVPPGTEPGLYHFYVKFIGDGTVLATQTVQVTVPGDCGLPDEPAEPFCGDAIVNQESEECDGLAPEGYVCAEQCVLEPVKEVAVCAEDLCSLEASCSDEVTYDDCRYTPEGERINCRVVVCGSDQQFMVKACEKPVEGPKEYFELYPMSENLAGYEICIGDTCIDDEGYVRSPDYCTEEVLVT